MVFHHKETLATHFEDICEIMKQYDTLFFFLGDGFVQVLLPMPTMQSPAELETL
jgi:hypothetical protein